MCSLKWKQYIENVRGKDHGPSEGFRGTVWVDGVVSCGQACAAARQGELGAEAAGRQSGLLIFGGAHGMVSSAASHLGPNPSTTTFWSYDLGVLLSFLPFEMRVVIEWLGLMWALNVS